MKRVIRDVLPTISLHKLKNTCSGSENVNHLRASGPPREQDVQSAHGPVLHVHFFFVSSSFCRSVGRSESDESEGATPTNDTRMYAWVEEGWWCLTTLFAQEHQLELAQGVGEFRVGGHCVEE